MILVGNRREGLKFRIKTAPQCIGSCHEVTEGLFGRKKEAAETKVPHKKRRIKKAPCGSKEDGAIWSGGLPERVEEDSEEQGSDLFFEWKTMGSGLCDDEACRAGSRFKLSAPVGVWGVT